MSEELREMTVVRKANHDREEDNEFTNTRFLISISRHRDFKVPWQIRDTWSASTYRFLMLDIYFDCISTFDYNLHRH